MVGEIKSGLKLCAIRTWFARHVNLSKETFNALMEVIEHMEEMENGNE